MIYSPLHLHSHYSLLDGLSKPEDIATTCQSLGITSCAITDHGTISGCVKFYQTMVKNNIKPILGCELYICDQSSELKAKDNAKLSHLVVLAKNLKGWKSLIKIVSTTNESKNFYYKPRIDIDSLAATIKGSKDLICISGHPGSTLANAIYDSGNLVENWESKALEHIKRLQTTFGTENTFVEIQLMDSENSYQQSIGLLLRDFAKKHNLQRVATIDAHYCKQEDAVDQRILLCSNLKTTIPAITNKILKNEDVAFSAFFTSDQYHIISPEKMQDIHEDIEIQNTINISNSCKSYDILSRPQLPKFICPGNVIDNDHLRQLCRNGWKNKIVGIIPEDKHHLYVERIKRELSILEESGLASYFLIVSDILDYIRSQNWLPGPGRGSAAGCLVSYLIGITSIDPIQYNLIFERFYNSGRNTSDRISMPDIDVDVPIQHREKIIQYIKDKYGHKKVSQMITFNTLKGRGALKEVLRVYDNMSFDEMNKITKNIPDEAKIADDLQDMRDEDGEASILRWALENNADKLKEWCYIDEQNNLAGPLAKRFEQAMRLEGTKYNQSKHAAGIAISSTSLDSLCPMVYDTKTDQAIAGLEMSDLEAIGVIKFDILGIALLDKMMEIKFLLLNGENNHAIF